MNSYYRKILLPTHPQIDTIVAIFLLKKFGKDKYPGIENIKIEICQTISENESSLLKKGVLAIDIGKGKFDHHFRKRTASSLVAEDLNLTDDPALNKLLSLVERDEKYGLGTISKDPLDKAFGLAGLVSSLNKVLPDNPQKVVDLILPIIYAHYIEERRREIEIPQEFERKLKEKKAEIFEVKQGKKKLKIVAIESGNPSIVGWLRSSLGVKADIVIQKTSSGHTNIITRPLKRPDLRLVIALLRTKETELKNERRSLPPLVLIKAGKIPEIPEWYYDLATNSILNGGVNPENTPPTSIPFEVVKTIVKDGLEQVLPQKKTLVFESEDNQYFIEIRITQKIGKEIYQKITNTSGIKMHLPENYHITLLYLGKLGEQKLPQIIEEIEKISQKINPFEIEINSRNLESGRIAGYETKAFYFSIQGEFSEILKEIRSKLERIFPYFRPQEFFPHLTIASVLPGIEEKFIQDVEIKSKEDFEIKFLVNKIRLTEIIKKSNGKTIYRNKYNFYLESTDSH